MRGHSGWWERDAEPYAPYIGHVSPDVILLDDGSLLTMGHLRGVPHELAAASERNAAARLLNGLWRNIADETVTICALFVRHRHIDKLSSAAFRNTFSEDFARAYEERVLEGKLYQNDWFLTVIASPRVPIGGQTTSREVNRRLARFRKRSVVDDYTLTTIEDLWTAVTRPLDGITSGVSGFARRAV
jgi:type IV secretion system protein VirB4